MLFSLQDLFSGRLDSLGTSAVNFPKCPQTGFNDCKVRLFHRQPRRLRKKTGIPTLAVFPERTSKRFFGLTFAKRRDWLRRLSERQTLFILFASTTSVPKTVQKECRDEGIATAASAYNAHLAWSRIEAIRRKIIKKTISFHGVVIEKNGQGVLITGPAGFGKTTAALNFTRKGAKWIADDLAIVQKLNDGALRATGHRKTRGCLWTQTGGIERIDAVLGKGHIKIKTILRLVIDVNRQDVEVCHIEKGVTHILGVTVPRISCRLPNTGYFNENLLENIVNESRQGN